MKAKAVFLCLVSLFLLFVQACGAVPQQVAEPTSTNLPPTSTAIPTEVPPSPTATITPFPAPSGPCDNFLYPLATGNEWSYQSSSNEQPQMALRVTEVSGDLASIHIDDLLDGVSDDDTVRCDEGAISNLPLVYLSLLLSDYLDGVLNTYQESGVTAPSLLDFVENNWHYSWSVKKLVEQPVKISPPGLDQSASILRSNVMTINSETQGVLESVEVPAGDFLQALLVESELTTPVTVGNTGGVFKVRYKEWYEPYVGLLKIQAYAASIDYAGFPLPFSMDKTLELNGYHLSNQ